jgi:Phage portal protein
MGLRDRIANALLGTNIEKAPNLPAGSVTMTEQQMRNISGQTNVTYGQQVPLERNPIYPSVPFSPGSPIVPGAINPPRKDDGRPDPRRYEYQVAQNINITETRLVPFRTLRGAADQIDILRRCIEVSKAKLLGLNWDITLGDDSAEKLISEIGGARVRAMSVARDRYTEEINRLRSFWEQPDKSNGLLFYDWLNIALEEILVLDAWAIWPQMSVGGDLIGLQILDGSTIKPLIDDRGMRPSTPYPAFQQILYGFPRSEFSAPVESEKADGEFTSDELAYFVRNRRAMSVYGYSPTERALPLADIYLRRQQWLRAEYTDGVTPELMIKTDANFGNNPDLLRAYENIFNSDLAGQTEQRKRVRLLPAGMEPVQYDGYGERFRDTLDEYLVNSICGHYGVLPSEIGFNPKNGLGGTGFQLGQAESSEVLGAIPLATWVGRMISHLSYIFLGMPRELEFKFMESGREDEEAIARTIDIQLKSGAVTLNEARSRAGMPLIEAVEADMPLVVAGNGAYLVTDSGYVSVEAQPELTADGETSPIDSTIPDEPIVEEGKAVQEELQQFLRWLKKSPTRAFRFKEVPVVYAEVLNKFVDVKDYDSARWYAERYLA